MHIHWHSFALAKGFNGNHSDPAIFPDLYRAAAEFQQVPPDLCAPLPN